MKILAVDDDPIFLSILEASFHAEGYMDISCVEAGQDALDLIDLPAVKFDCILLDINMPEMDGIELCKRIRALSEYKRIPIFMITATLEREQIDAALRAGATDYLHKPIETVELIARIGVANILIRDNWERNKIAHKASVYKEQVEKTLAFSLYDAVSITEVENVISAAEFDNYLLRLGRLKMFRSCIVAMTIAEFPELFGRFDTSQVLEILEDVADSIQASSFGSDFLLTYYGGGDFLCVTDRSNAPNFVNAADAIHSVLNSLEMNDGEGHPINLSILVSDPVLPSLLSAGRPEQIVATALASVSDKRNCWHGGRQDRRFFHPEPKLAPH